MNGALAALFLSSALLDPEVSILDNYGLSENIPFQTVGIGKLEFQKEWIGSDYQFTVADRRGYGPLQRTHSLSITDHYGLWVGTGFNNPIALNNRLLVRFSFLPGVYQQGGEVDLGGWLMFRSGVELEFSLSEVISLSVSYDHRSSGDLWPYNPGLESWQIRISKKIF